MTAASQYFSNDYFSARKKFKHACDKLNLEIISFENPTKGPAGEKLFVDTVWIGPEDAEQVILLISGTHGVEGFIGSACQIGWMSGLKDEPLPDNMAALVIHIINPYGMAWLCVETQENIDLNRNFIDYSMPLPSNLYYEQLHDVFTCHEISGVQRQKAELIKQQFIDNNGFDIFLEAAAKGQYQHEDGFNFGGKSEAWSNTVLLSRYETTGGLADSIQQSIQQAEVTTIVLEYGTYEIDRIASAMLNRFWLSQHGVQNSEQGIQIKQEIKDCFYPDEPKWQNKTFKCSQQIIKQAIAGLQKT